MKHKKYVMGVDGHLLTPPYHADTLKEARRCAYILCLNTHYKPVRISKYNIFSRTYDTHSYVYHSICQNSIVYHKNHMWILNSNGSLHRIIK